MGTARGPPTTDRLVDLRPDSAGHGLRGLPTFQIMGSKVLVTGAAGFIGSHVCRHLLQQGHAVVALDDLSGGFEDHVPVGAGFVRGSINDATLVRSLFAEHRFEVALSVPLGRGLGLDLGTSYQFGRHGHQQGLVVKLLKEFKSGGILHVSMEAREHPALFAGIALPW